MPKPLVLFTSQGSHPLKHATVKGRVQRVFDHELKAYCHQSVSHSSGIVIKKRSLNEAGKCFLI